MVENDTLKKVREFAKFGWEDNHRWRPRARKNLRFYVGNPWDEADKKKLAAEGRPALSINRILPVVNFQSGLERQNRSDARVYPRRGGTANVATAQTELLKHLMDVSNGPYIESMAFYSSLILCKGWLGVDINYEYDPLNGDIIVEDISAFDMVEDRRKEKYDLNKSAEFIIRQSWEKKADLILDYPKKKGEIERGGLELPDESPDMIDYEREMDNDDDDYGRHDDNNDIDPLIRRERKGYRVRLTHYKKREKRIFLIDRATMEVKPVTDKKENLEIAKALLAMKPDRFAITERVVPVLHRVKTVGNIVLEEKYDPFSGVCKFPYVRISPFWIEGNVMGVVDNLIDPQEEHNKRRSQILAILNTAASSGWIVKQFKGAYKTFLETFGSKPGVCIEEAKCGGKVEKIQPQQLPQGHFAMSETSATDIKEISSVDANLMGTQPGKDESGRSRYLRQQQGMMASEIIFDNFRYSRQIFAQFLLDIMRKTNYYSESEIRAILDQSGEEIDMAQLQSFAIGRYGVKVDQSQSHPTTRMMNYEMLLEAAQLGLPIDPRFLIEASDLPNKEKIIQDLEQKMKQMQNQLPRGKQGAA